MICPSCGAENRTDGKFCFECGTPLARSCETCGTFIKPGAKFCDECGTRVATTPIPGRVGPESERRLVSVLFADLVGFTTLSESRDPEEVREQLSRYFDTSRQLIARYGGTVEKFIGDAVMAVWGTPVAQEDDAERAVRAALELTTAVAELGREVGAPDLRARAGVLTGEAAVAFGAEGQGMVAGDLVNTASRVQAVATPGTVFVGEATRRATEAAIAYEDAGPHELRGKSGLVPLWRAVRVIAGARGALKSTGLEPPFVGRDRELRLVKELFHAAADDGKARLVSIVGVAGVGKSRLVWEFFKYFDGLPQNTWWQRGRCLAYGDGVTYWALAEMVRMRARIAEGEDAASAMEKLHRTVEQHVPDPDERKWVEPRLAHLLGLEETTVREKEDLFSAWRVFFERLAEVYPCVMVFEDMQWADAALLDFVEYLLEWSRNSPLYVVTSGRPELLEKRPNWGAAQRSATSLSLEPLSQDAMDQLLEGFVPGLTAELRTRIRDRAQGIPLYAVETVRMLLDRGLLVQEGSVYRPAGPIDALDVPETLQALIAARLDGLAPGERRAVQDASILGKTFTKESLAAIGGLPPSELEHLLASLVRKEVLSIQADPRSPERGQYGFLQDLVKRVAYETLSRRDRKAKHLAAASHLEEAWGTEDEIVEVVAAHYLDAYRAVPEAADAAEIKAKARDMLGRAGERAGSLAATRDAQRYFEHAAELADDPSIEAELLERAGQMALEAGIGPESRALFDQAIELFEARDDTHSAARVAARLGELDWADGRLEQGIERMERAYRTLSEDEPDEGLAMLAAEIGRLHFFRGTSELGMSYVEAALDMGEPLRLWEVISQALNTKSLISLYTKRRPEEAVALLSHALRIALEHDLHSSALRAYNNLAFLHGTQDRHDEEIATAREGAELARRIGSRWWEWGMVAGTIAPLIHLGRWDEAIEVFDGIKGDPELLSTLANDLFILGFAYVNRGDAAEADNILALLGELEKSEDLQRRGGAALAHAFVVRRDGDPRAALELARTVMDRHVELSWFHQLTKDAFVESVEANLALGDVAAAERLLVQMEGLGKGELTPYPRAQLARFRARLAIARDGDRDVDADLRQAAALFRELPMPFWMAVTLLEHGEWLVARGRAEEAGPLLAEAGAAFESLKARPWLDRLATVLPERAAAPA